MYLPKQKEPGVYLAFIPKFLCSLVNANSTRAPCSRVVLINSV